MIMIINYYIVRLVFLVSFVTISLSAAAAAAALLLLLLLLLEFIEYRISKQLFFYF